VSAQQRQRILNMLIAAHGEFIPAVELARVSLQYNARIFEIRRLGYNVESRTSHPHGRGGVVHSWFRLIPFTTDSSTRPEAQAEPDDALLFADMREKHRDEN
jgi:hypothetical protein